MPSDGGILLTPRNMPVPLLHRLGQLVPQAGLVVEDGVLLVLEAGRLVGRDLVLGPHLVVLLDHLAGGVQLGDQLIDLGVRQKSQ